jgi:hypothetical protein
LLLLAVLAAVAASAAGATGSGSLEQADNNILPQTKTSAGAAMAGHALLTTFFISLHSQIWFFYFSGLKQKCCSGVMLVVVSVIVIAYRKKSAKVLF